MGSSSSKSGAGGKKGKPAGKEKFDEHGRKILSPAERAEQRFIRAYEVSGDEASADFADVDQTVDRYDYLIVFPNPPRAVSSSSSKSARGVSSLYGGGYQGQDEEQPLPGLEGSGRVDDDRNPIRRIKLHEIYDIWYSAVPGDEVVKVAARERLRLEFQSFFRMGEGQERRTAEEDEISVLYNEWLHMARNVIVNTLYSQSGLQLKLALSKDQSQVLCRVRAPVSLLEEQAARESYRLQLRGEIDPGYDFWTEEEITEEQSLISSKDEANELLERLYHVGKISPADISVFEDEPTAKQWSRRIHALERISDKVPVTNRFPAYADFSMNPKERHLFETYLSIRGRTLFKVKERLILTKGIIGGYYDLGILEAHGIIECFTALHDANRGSTLTRQVLAKRWTQVWTEESHLVGAPMVSMKAMDHGKSVSWYMRPWSQPLNDVRDYFGEKLALYFAWLGFYGWALILPAIICLGVEIYLLAYDVSFHGWDPAACAVGVMMIIWGTVYKQLWDREEKVVAVKWGTRGFVDAEKDRPNFKGDVTAPGGGRRRDPITNTYMTYFPSRKRRWRQAMGLLVVFVFICFLLALVQFTVWFEHYLTAVRGYSWGSTAGSLLSSIQIQLLGALYGGIVVRLNDYENYRTDTAYEYNLIFKTFLFQMFNNYSALAYQAFIIKYTYGCVGSCVDEVRELLLSIFFVRFVMAGKEVIDPKLAGWLAKRKQALAQAASAAARAREGRDDDLNQDLGRDEEPYEAELLLPEYGGTFDDYAAILLQFGYVTMFACALPLVVPLAMCEVLLQIRVDAFKLVDSFKRPDPEIAEHVGMWGDLIEVMCLMSVFTNTAIICFTMETLADYPWMDQLLIWLVMEHGLLAIKTMLSLGIPDMPGWLKMVEGRQQFVVTKHKYGFVRDDDGEDGHRGEKMSRRNHGDIVGLQVEKKEVRRLGQEEREEFKRLQSNLRDTERELRLTKDQLQAAYANETFNESTGIGETKHGLPLGCLNIKLIRLEGIEADPNSTSIIISLRPTRPGDTNPPGPAPQMSRPAEPVREVGLGNHAMEFNQVFVMAPIRTQDAELTFDITLKRTGRAPRRLGTCRVPIRELDDQLEKDLPLPISKKNQAGRWEATSARLFVKVKFMYSKIVPLRNRIYILQDQKRTTERALMALQFKTGDADA